MPIQEIVIMKLRGKSTQLGPRASQPANHSALALEPIYVKTDTKGELETWVGVMGIAKYNKAGRDDGKQAVASIWTQAGVSLSM